MKVESIECRYCGNRVAVVDANAGYRLAQHDMIDVTVNGPCRGSSQIIRGNWRDDPTYRHEMHLKREDGWR